MTDYKDYEEDNEFEKGSNNAAIIGRVSQLLSDNLKDTAERYSKTSAYSSKNYPNKANNAVRNKAFNGTSVIKDAYADNNNLVKTQAEAKLKYGDNWQKHSAEADHIIPKEQIHKQYHDNPWVSQDELVDIVNGEENLAITSRKINNAKRSRTNSELVSDLEYRKSKGLKISDEKMLDESRQADKYIKGSIAKTTTQNVINTGTKAGMDAALPAVVISGGLSTVSNIVAVVKGEKNGADAITDVSIDTVKGTAFGVGTAALGSIISQTVFKETLISSTNAFKSALGSSLPFSIASFGIETLALSTKLASCEINGKEFAAAVRERGTVALFSAAGYAAGSAAVGMAAGEAASIAIGQALIPIPVVGAMVGSMVGYALSTAFFKAIGTSLEKLNEPNASEKRRMAEDEYIRVKAEMERYRAEIEKISEAYFADRARVFSTALNTIRDSLINGDTDGVICGANMITEKLGGTVQYRNMEEFNAIFDDEDSCFIL